MSCRIPNVIFTGSARRREAVEEARELGRMGAERPGDELLLGVMPNPSDTYIGELVNAFEDGRAEREASTQIAPPTAGSKASC